MSETFANNLKEVADKVIEDRHKELAMAFYSQINHKDFELLKEAQILAGKKLALIAAQDIIDIILEKIR